MRLRISPPKVAARVLKRLLPGLFTVLLAAWAGASCGRLAFNAVDQAATHSTAREGVGAIEVPPKFRAVRVVEGLTYPSSMTWDHEGTSRPRVAHGADPAVGAEDSAYRPG